MPKTPGPGVRTSRPQGDRDRTADGRYSPPNSSLRPFPQDRAAVITTAVIALIFRSPTPRDLRLQIETLLREEFADAVRQALADTRLLDP
jgi:hypothetical protein